MKLTEAIEILEGEAHLAERQPETGVYAALKLGIEALGREESWRRLHPHLAIQPLEGETKE